jgi:hypothetical protein
VLIQQRKSQILIQKSLILSAIKNESGMQFIKTYSILLLLGVKLLAQTDSTASGTVEVMVIDSYITQELPHKFVLSFFTSERCSSKIIFLNNIVYDISKVLTEDHKFELEIGKLNTRNEFSYQLIVYDSTGQESRSELFDEKLPDDFVIPDEENPGLFSICLGAVVFAIPSPTYVLSEGSNHWSLCKEIPLLNFYSRGYNYPAGYIGLEYSHIFNADRKNFLRIGYKQVIQSAGIKYFAPGAGVFSDLRGFNGLSAELSAGLFQIQNVFTFYTRFRYNFQFVQGGKNFSEISAGLYSNFFSLNL